MTNVVQEDIETAVERRRDEALRRALNTPPQPKPDSSPKPPARPIQRLPSRSDKSR